MTKFKLMVTAIVVLSLALVGAVASARLLAPSVLPDLVISRLQITTRDLMAKPYWAGCVDAYAEWGVGVEIRNIGQGKANKFSLVLDGISREVPEGLAAGESVTLFFGEMGGIEHQAKVDSKGEIFESDETNNMAIEPVLVPTLSPVCTSVPMR